MQKFTAIINKIPEQELAIRRLCKQDDDFMTACADFEDATTAFHHWSEAANENTARADEYLHVMEDLETEILERLKTQPVREAQHGD